VCSESCPVGRRANSDVLIGDDSKNGYYDDDGAPYRHIDDITPPILRHLTSPLPSANSNAAVQHSSNIIVIINVATVTSLIQRVIGCLHDPANVQQTSSISTCIMNTFVGRLLDVCWTFAGSCNHPINVCLHSVLTLHSTSD